ncbi:glutamate racemase [Aerococcus agrisoli]|uniref:Glutamate racemase n=1 Tax=Aerococcus agrisoli TaxID=2487350 RepID=A0A3N4GNC8_9LACT|nr:glutamate racemase [Aerococcus agrisoli]RPA60110.1 glutamate racemase [Aerococcus agrisoli]
MNRPIGFLDSGVGGLTVVKEAMRQLPNESIIYIGDNARCPYGPRSVEEISKFTNQMVDFLLTKDIKLLVIACNTATAVCLDEIKARVEIPVIGVIQPGARAANKYTENGKIGVLGTEGTIKSGMYVKTLRQKNKTLKITSLACPPFVPLVESQQYNTPLAKKVVAEALVALKNKGLDTVVLGCTHYPLLRDLIQKTLGNTVTLIDSGQETISDVSILLDYNDIAKLSDDDSPTRRNYYTTGSPELFKEIADDWLEGDIHVERVTISELETIQANMKRG